MGGQGKCWVETPYTTCGNVGLLPMALLCKGCPKQFHETVRTKDSMPGMALTYALIQMVEKVAEANGMF